MPHRPQHAISHVRSRKTMMPRKRMGTRRTELRTVWKEEKGGIKNCYATIIGSDVINSNLFLIRSLYKWSGSGTKVAK